MNKGTAIDDVQHEPLKLGIDYGKDNPEYTSAESSPKSSDGLPYTGLTHKDSDNVSLPSITAYPRTSRAPIADNLWSEIFRINSEGGLDMGSYGQCYPVVQTFPDRNSGGAAIDDVQLKPVKLGTDYGKDNPEPMLSRTVSISSESLPYTDLTHEESDYISVPSIAAYPRTPPPTPIAPNNVLSEIDRIFAKRALDSGSYSQCYPVAQAFPGKNNNPAYRRRDKILLLYLIIFASGIIFGFYML